MGEPATPTSADRAITRVWARSIVDSVASDEVMPLSQPGSTAGMILGRRDVEDLAFQLAQEIVLLHDQLDFIGQAVMTALQTAVPDDAKSKIMAEIWNAAREHKVPDWWPAFRAERDARSKHQ